MSNPPAWLPEPLCFEDFKGNWEEFISVVYQVFTKDFKQSKLVWEQLPVAYDAKIIDGKEAGFWHIVQKEDSGSGERVPDIRRCEHISWPRPIIEHSGERVISVWKTERKTSRRNQRQIRVLIWFEHLDYIVILGQRPALMILITAYCVEHESYRQKLRRERDDYYKMQKPPFRTT